MTCRHSDRRPTMTRKQDDKRRVQKTLDFWFGAVKMAVRGKEGLGRTGIQKPRRSTSLRCGSKPIDDSRILQYGRLRAQQVNPAGEISIARVTCYASKSLTAFASYCQTSDPEDPADKPYKSTTPRDRVHQPIQNKPPARNWRCPKSAPVRLHGRSQF